MALGTAYRVQIDGCLDGRIGAHGISTADLEATLGELSGPIADLKRDIAGGRMPALSIARERADIEPARAALDRLCRGAETVVFFGTGGSSLGGQTLAQLGGWNIPGAALPTRGSRPRTRFHDNLDPDTLTRAIARFEPATTRYVVTSKSGNTPETLTQAIVAIKAILDAGLGARLPDVMLGITEPAVAGRTNGLRSLFESRGIPLIDHHPDIGGRYSVLSTVGILPALARGLDVGALRAGAESVLDQLDRARSPADAPPAVGAALGVTLHRARGINVHVMMPYADRLRSLGPWFGQLWAESLGKDGRGTTPVACLGPLDQHSQLQMLMDGPRAHLTTVLRLDSRGQGVTVDPALAREAGLDMMAGRPVGDLVAAQARGVPDALAAAGRPVRLFDLERIDETTLGALLMHFMIETILAGRLYGIDPFDQPAVELGKVLTRKLLVEG
jgi:glucose-6-phosphate isomerase